MRRSIFKLLTDYCPPYSRVTTCDESVPALEAPAGDIALLAAVGRILEAGLEDLLRVGVGRQFKLEVFIASERVDELVLLLSGLHCGIWLCGFDILIRWTTKCSSNYQRGMYGIIDFRPKFQSVPFYTFGPAKRMSYWYLDSNERCLGHKAILSSTVGAAHDPIE